MPRIQFPTFEAYRRFIDSLPVETKYDEDDLAVKTGDFSHLRVTIPDFPYNFIIDRPPRPQQAKHELLFTYTHIYYKCVCGEVDSFNIDGDNTTGVHTGCCDNTVYAYRMPNGKIELDDHEREEL